MDDYLKPSPASTSEADPASAPRALIETAEVASGGTSLIRLPSRVERADIAVIHALKPWFAHPLMKLAATIAKAGDEPPILAIAGTTLLAGLVSRNHRLARAGLRMTAAQTLAIALKNFGKNRVDRTRPWHMLKTGEYRMRYGSSGDPSLQSLPSGHTAGSIAIARAAAREYPGARVALLGTAGAMGLLQLPRRAHFPTDILAGAVVGIAAEAITQVIWRRVFRR